MKTWDTLALNDIVYLYEDDSRLIPAYRQARTDADRERIRLDPREHWLPHAIIDQNRTSWILKNRRKLPKKARPTDLPVVLISEEEVTDAVFVATTKRKVARIIENLRNTADNAIPLRLIIRTLENLGIALADYGA